MAGWSRRGAWALVLLVLGPWLLAGLLAALGGAPGRAEPAPLPAADGTAPHVVLIGIPGLTWDVIDETTTPSLAGLAREGGAAALVLRGTHEVTCAADAWLTLGAGQRASTDVAGCQDADLAGAEVGEVVQDGSVVPDVWRRWQDAAARRALTGEPGTLAVLAERAGTCVAAYGTAAVLGAAGPDGVAAVSVAAEEGSLPRPVPGQASAGSTVCRVHLVSAPPVLDPGAAAEVDEAVGAFVADLPPGTSVLVAGLGHTSASAAAMALVAHPVGEGAGAVLSSGSTRQDGLVQLTDLTPTLLHLAGVAPPAPGAGALAGQPLTALSLIHI